MKILVVEDGSDVSNGLRHLIDAAGNDFVVQSTRESGAEEATVEFCPDAIFAVSAGTAVATKRAIASIRRLRSRGARSVIVLISARDSSDIVREAIRAGAQDVLFSSELDPRTVGMLLAELRERVGLSQDVARRSADPSAPVKLIGGSQAMNTVKRLVSLVAQSSSPVLIVGETGTGKGLVSRAIHDAGPRRREPYLATNCAATPANLMESVMFGHERGSFTGAFKRQRGHFELVGAGTLLLDEVAEIPMELQPKLLRAVEDRFFRPIGAEEEVPFGGRILASTNADLSDRMHSGRFRPDLYYRLGVLVVRMPSLAERPEDIPDLVAEFAAVAEHPVHFSDEAIAWLAGRRWPGNVRELRNAVERLSVLCPEGRVNTRDVEMHIGEDSHTPSRGVDRAARIIASLPGTLSRRFEAIEGAVVRIALRDSKGNRSAAARVLGVHRRVIDRHASGWRGNELGRDSDEP